MIQSKHFNDILELQSYFHEHEERGYLSHLWNQLYPGHYIWIDASGTPESRGRIAPLDLGSFLYRGQTKEHDICVPSIFRKNSSKEELIKSFLKIAEFHLLCLSHPGVQKCLEFGLDVEFTGLAQHYGLETSYLDLTQSNDISAFFATCMPNSKGRFRPHKGDGVGVIYRVRHELVSRYSKPILIGKQPFSRPEAQKAWAIEINQNIDFSKLYGVETFTFDHSSHCSKKIFKLFNKGKDLLPFDMIENKVNNIKKANSFSKKALENVINSRYFGDDQAINRRNILRVLNNSSIITISDESPVHFSSSELKALNAEWDKKGKYFLKNVGAIFASENIN